MILVLVGLLVLIALETRSADLFNKKWSVNTHNVGFLQISKDGTKILSNNGTETIIFDIQTGDTLKIFTGKGKFSEDGLYTLITKEIKDSLDKNIFCIDVFNYQNNELVKSMKFPNLRFSNYDIYSSIKGDQLLFSRGTILTFIDFESGGSIIDTGAFDVKELYGFPTTYYINWIQYSNDGNKLFVDRSRIVHKGGGSDSQIISFNTKTFEREYVSSDFKSKISLAGENDILTYANVTDKDTACVIYDTKNKITLKKILGNGAEITHLNLSHDIKYLALMKAGENLKILSFQDLQPIQEFVMSDYEFLTEFSKDGKYFAIGNNMTIDLYEIGTIGVDNVNNIISTIYPNPSNGFVQIKSDCQNESCKCEIYGINGDKLIDIPIIFNNSGLISIDLGIAKSGIYYVVLSKNNKIETYKIVKE